MSSGSKGNAVYIEYGSSRILLDAGLGPRALADRLAEIGRSLEDLSAVFLTHEHTDHVRGVKALSKKYPVPVYSTRGTYEQMQGSTGKVRDWRCLDREDEVSVGALKVECYATPHDAAESVAFVVRCGTRQLGHATDLGCINRHVEDRLQNCDALLVEANHDVGLLESGPYPWPVKQRIKSDVGHLSNEACGALLSAVDHDALQTVVLMHLSEQNNRPEYAVQAAQNALANESVRLVVARQNQPTRLITID